MAELTLQTVYPNSKLDKVVLTSLTAGTTYTFLNGGYTMLIVQSETAGAKVLTYDERKGLTSGAPRTDSITVTGIDTNPLVSVAHGNKPSHVNSPQNRYVSFSPSVDCKAAVVQFVDGKYGADEFVEYQDLLGKVDGDANTVSTTEDITLSESTIIVGMYLSADGYAFTGNGNATDNNATASLSIDTAGMTAAGAASDDLFIIHATTDAFGSTATMSASAGGDLRYVAFSPKNRDSLVTSNPS